MSSNIMTTLNSIIYILTCIILIHKIDQTQLLIL